MPARRALLWGLLAAAILGVAVAAFCGRRWADEGRGEPPPVLGEAPPFQLLNRDGRLVTREDLLGRPWVASFVFTRCALSCPRITAQLLRLGVATPAGGLRRVSITVDPKRDTPEVLEAYARSYGIADPDWYFLTGDEAAVHAVVREGFRLALDDSAEARAASPAEPIVHSSRLVLVDAGGRIRGYYDAFVPGGLDRLAADVARLGSERDP